MAREKVTRGTWWCLSLKITLYLLLVVVQGREDTDEGYRNGKNLVLEYFLPINLPAAAMEIPREKRDIEGSGDDTGFNSIGEKSGENERTDPRTFGELEMALQDEKQSNHTTFEGSGEVNEDDNSSKENDDEGKVTTATEPETTTQEVKDYKDSSTKEPESVTETQTKEAGKRLLSFDKELGTTPGVEEQTTVPAEILGKEKVKDDEGENEDVTTVETPRKQEKNKEEDKDVDVTTIETPGKEEKQVEENKDENKYVTTVETPVKEEGNKNENEDVTVESPRKEEKKEEVKEDEDKDEHEDVTTVKTWRKEDEKEKAKDDDEDEENVTQESTTAKVVDSTILPILIPGLQEATSVVPDTVSSSTEVHVVPSNQIPVEEPFIEAKIAQKKVEALPGNILQKENMTMGVDPKLIITNTRVMDSEETVQRSSSEPRRLGAYIVIGLILLSFSSLVGYITFRKRLNRKRQNFESHQEINDTEKALLSLSDYKDNADLEENHLKNNEITPIVVKSNSQINKFEKNTNFSSPKNLNTIANEKNIEKDNVLKSTTENLTQVIIEESPKDVEEDKNAPCLEKLIVTTKLDQDSIPKKPIFIHRTNTGYISIPQDNV